MWLWQDVTQVGERPDVAYEDGLRWKRRTFLCASRTVAYTLRASRRARYPSMTIRPETGLVVTVPTSGMRQPLERFLQRHERWILHQVERIEQIAGRVGKRWPYGETLPYRGIAHRVFVRHASRYRSAVTHLPDEALFVDVRRPTIESARRLLARWYRAQAERWLTERTHALSTRLGVSWTRLTVRDQRSRWGSCSVSGTLSFNYRLVMAPPAVLDYVVMHELAHRWELNHSSRFWALVARHCPTYRESVAWLNTYGPFLTL